MENTDKNIPRMTTISETAALSGLSPHFVRKLCLERKIVFIRAGNKYLINFEKLLEFLDKGEQDGM